MSSRAKSKRAAFERGERSEPKTVKPAEKVDPKARAKARRSPRVGTHHLMTSASHVTKFRPRVGLGVQQRGRYVKTVHDANGKRTVYGRVNPPEVTLLDQSPDRFVPNVGKWDGGLPVGKWEPVPSIPLPLRNARLRFAQLTRQMNTLQRRRQVLYRKGLVPTWHPTDVTFETGQRVETGKEHKPTPAQHRKLERMRSKFRRLNAQLAAAAAIRDRWGKGWV